MKKLTSDELLSILNDCWGLYDWYGIVFFVGEIDFTEQVVQLLSSADDSKPLYRIDNALIDEGDVILTEYSEAKTSPPNHVSFIPLQQINLTKYV